MPVVHFIHAKKDLIQASKRREFLIVYSYSF